MSLYKHKPKQIKSAKDLLTFVKGIPPRFFCFGEFDDGRGRRCILGHLGEAYLGRGRAMDGYSAPSNDIPKYQLVAANNGRDWLSEASKSGKSIKSRLIKFLKANINR